MKRLRLLEKKQRRQQYFVSYKINTIYRDTNRIISYKDCSLVYRCITFNNLKLVEFIMKDISDERILYTKDVTITSVSKVN